MPRKGRGKRKRAQSAADHLPNGFSWPHVSLLSKSMPAEQVAGPRLLWQGCCLACLWQCCPKPLAARAAAIAHNRHLHSIATSSARVVAEIILCTCCCLWDLKQQVSVDTVIVVHCET